MTNARMESLSRAGANLNLHPSRLHLAPTHCGATLQLTLINGSQTDQPHQVHQAASTLQQRPRITQSTTTRSTTTDARTAFCLQDLALTRESPDRPIRQAPPAHVSHVTARARRRHGHVPTPARRGLLRRPAEPNFCRPPVLRL